MAKLQAWGLALLGLLLAVAAAFGVGRYSGSAAAKKAAQADQAQEKADAAVAVTEKTTKTVEQAHQVEHQVQEMPEDEARKKLADDWTRG